MDEGRDPAPREAVTDAVLNGRLVLRQFRRGHRAGTDAILLAAAAHIAPGDRFVDVGAGVGTVGLALALRGQDLTGVLLEADAEVARLAADNCRLNGMEARIAVAPCSLFDPQARRRCGLENGTATLVVTNPPFFAGSDTRASADPLKAAAHGLGDPGRGHGDWLRQAVGLLAPKGRFHAIHRPEALAALLSACEGRLGAVTILPVQARGGEAAIRILLAGVKGSRAPLRILPALVLHDPDGAFTARAEALHRGEALRL